MPLSKETEEWLKILKYIFFELNNTKTLDNCSWKKKKKKKKTIGRDLGTDQKAHEKHV